MANWSYDLWALHKQRYISECFAATKVQYNKTLFFLLYAMYYKITYFWPQPFPSDLFQKHTSLWQLMNFPCYFVCDSDLGKWWLTCETAPFFPLNQNLTSGAIVCFLSFYLNLPDLNLKLFCFDIQNNFRFRSGKFRYKHRNQRHHMWSFGLVKKKILSCLIFI